MRRLHVIGAVLAAVLLPAPTATAGACTAVGTSFEDGLDGLTVLHGSANVQRRVRLEGCRALRMAPRTVLARALAPGPQVDLAFAYRGVRPAHRTVLTLGANGMRVVDDGRGRVLVLRGRRLLGRARRAHGRAGWARLHVRIVVGGRVSLWLDGRYVGLRPRRARQEGRALFGGRSKRRGGALFLDGFTVKDVPPAPPAAAPPPSPAADASAVDQGAQLPFAPDSVWNAPLAVNAALDPSSASRVAELRRQLTLAAPWINTTAYSTPVYRVAPNQPTVRVTLDANSTALQRALEAVPLPADARPADGSDQHLVVWQPATDTMWEFFGLRRVDGAWHTRWGGRMTGVSRSPGFFSGDQSNWGATATSLPLLGGLVTLDDLARGSIDHALAMGIPQAQRGSWAWPAQRTDGGYDTHILEGARFRLDPTVNVDQMALAPLVRMLAKAAQRYGILVRDQSGAIVFYGEDPSPTGTNPWASWFGTASRADLMRQFPWQYLQALSSTTSTAVRP
jgi:hypothetical protein